MWYNKQAHRYRIQKIEVNFLVLLIVNECFGMPFCFFLPPFPYLEIGNKDSHLFVQSHWWRISDKNEGESKACVVHISLQWTRKQPCVINFIMLFVFLSHWLMCTWQKEKRSRYMYAPLLEKEGCWLQHQHTWLFLAKLHIKCSSDSLETPIQHEFYHI